KEAIRQEVEKENELKRLKQLEEEQEVIRARATLSGPKTVGKIDLDDKKKDDATKAPKEEKPVDKASEPVQQLESKPKQETKEEVVEKAPAKEDKPAEVKADKAEKAEPKKEEKPVAKTPEKPAEPAKEVKKEEVKKPE